MNEDPIVAEVRRIRAEIFEEAGHDFDKLAAMIEESVARIAPTVPVVRNAEELRRVVAQQEAANAVREKPRNYGE